MEKRQCQHCGHAFPMSMSRCPHCALPGLFPNVDMAKLDREQRTLDRRHGQAVRDAERRGCGNKVRDFEARCGESKAVIARSLGETLRLASGDHNVYATYHQLAEIEFRIPEGSKWDVLRTLTDHALFGDYKREVRFAALSLDGLGLMGYGECSWVARNEMIAHRASVFEENSVMFMERLGIALARAHKLPPGYRAPWEQRPKLCVAKLAEKIRDDISDEELAELLLRQGTTSEEDEFVEVHIGGPMTVRTLERVIVKKGVRQSKIGKVLREKLDGFGVLLEGRSWTQ